MRIERLGLTRFGIFDGEELDLSHPGVHVVVGRNEAGKTTAMTAIRQLFYDIPVRTVHDFIHAKPDLRIDAEISNGDGRRLEIVRLKRNIDPLVDPSGDPIDANVLAKFLNDLGEEAFSRLFTIGHDEIARGGQALLDDEGELGAAVFGVRGGAVSLTSVMGDLDARAAALFKKSAPTRLINAAVKRYKDAVAQAGAQSRSAAEVVSLDAEIEALGEQHHGLSGRRSELSQRRDLLVQVHNSVRLLARREDAIGRRDAIAGQGPLVPEAFGGTLEHARAEAREAKVGLDTITASIEQLRAQAETITLDSGLLEQREAIEGLHEALGENTTNKGDLPGLRARLEEAQERLDELLRKLPSGTPVDERGLPKLTVDQRSRMEQLADREQELTLTLGTARTEHEAARRAADRIAADIDETATPIDVSLLRVLVDRIAEQGPLEVQLSEREVDLAKRVQRLETGLAELGLDPVDPRAVASLPVPSKETIRGFASQMGALTRDMDSVRASITEHGDRLSLLQGELAELLLTEDPPSRDEVTAARDHRDAGWNLIRAVWLDGMESDDDAVAAWTADPGGPSLDRSYEKAVVTADELADRLWSGADSVARRAQLESSIAEAEGVLADLGEDSRRFDETHERLQRQWLEPWAPIGVRPTTPELMEQWRETWDMWSSRAAQVVEDQIENDGRRTVISRNRADLVATMEACGVTAPVEASLAALVDQARMVIDRSTDDAGRLSSLRERLATAQETVEERRRALDAAEERLSEWNRQWAEAVVALHLSSDDTPTTARDLLRVVDEIDTVWKNVASLRGRINGIHERISDFGAEVRAVLERLPEHSDLSAEFPELTVRELSTRLTRAADAATRRGELDGQLAQHEASAESTRRKHRVAVGMIEELVTEAGVANEEELAAAIERSDEHRRMSAEIVTTEDDLRGVGAGSAVKTITELQADAEAMRDVDTAAEIESIDLELDGLTAELNTLNQALGEKRGLRSAIDDEDRAARSATSAEDELAQLETLVEEYTRVVLARRLIEEHVTSLREQSQGPLVRRASELFSRLTLGAYSGLYTDATADGKPVVIARTADDRGRGVDALSTGTRDQLYLALRLAALEQYIERNAPLPLVLDDLFVHFDDDRTSAGLSVLDELSEVTQVLLFTHHGHVAELARKSVRPAMLQVHELGA